MNRSECAQKRVIVRLCSICACAAVLLLVAGALYTAAKGRGFSDRLVVRSFLPKFSVSNVNLDRLRVGYQWHTFYGSTVEDVGNAIQVDPIGDVIVAGYSLGSWPGDNSQPPLHAHSGNKDILVMKLGSDGHYIWHTFYGNNAQEDEAKALAADGSGNIYIVGYSGASWLGENDKPPLNYCSGGKDLIVVKLNSSGHLVWHTCIGGGGDDEGTGVSVAQDGSAIFITGTSNAPWQGPAGQNPKHSFATDGHTQLFVLKLTSSGGYLWHTFYGGSSTMAGGYSFASDSYDNVVVVGYSTGGWAGDGNTPPKHPFTTGEPGVDAEIMALKLSKEGIYLWHTFYGTTENDYGNGVAIDADDQIYLAGNCPETWNGDNGELPLHDFAETDQGGTVVMKLSDAGIYQWHTFYGGKYGQSPASLALDQLGSIYVTGTTGYSWLGDNGEEPLHDWIGGWELFALKLSNAGAYRWHTFYGSHLETNGKGIIVDQSKNVFLTGRVRQSFLGDGDRDPLHAYSGTNKEEIFTIKLVAMPNEGYLPLIIK